MNPTTPAIDAFGYYVPPDENELDHTPDKIYGRLNKPEGGALITTAWCRHTLFGSAPLHCLADDFYDHLTEPTKDYLSQKPIRFRQAEHIEQYLDQGHILETRFTYIRRDEDEGHKLPDPPAGLEAYWREVL